VCSGNLDALLPVSLPSPSMPAREDDPQAEIEKNDGEAWNKHERDYIFASTRRVCDVRGLPFCTFSNARDDEICAGFGKKAG